MYVSVCLNAYMCNGENLVPLEATGGYQILGN